jgi:hypothetical protein
LQHLIHGFPLSGPESGHTERLKPSANALASRPFSFIRTLTVGFGITPNLLTLCSRGIREWIDGNQALAGLGFFTFTAGGDFHPALRTSAPRLSGLKGTMAIGRGASKDLRNRNLHIPNDPKAELRREMRQNQAPRPDR